MPQLFLKHFKGRELLRYIGLTFLGCLIFYPFIAIFLLSGKTNYQFDHAPWVLTIPFHWEHYSLAFTVVNKYIWNTIIVTSISCVGVLVLSSLSAYVIARFTFPGKEFIYYTIISLLMFPSVLTLIASFMLVKNLGLLNTRAALILPYIANGQVFGIFLLRIFFVSIPKEIFEAARIDGASDLKCYTSIALPLSKPIMGTLAIINVMGNWNDLIWPLVTISEDRLRTITIGLAFFQGQYYTNWGPLFAGYIIASVPLVILFAFASKQFVQGMMSGSLKM